LPDHTLFLPPPPAPSSPLAAADVALLQATRVVGNGPRWQLATSDNELGMKPMLAHFGCALGVDITQSDMPALTRVLTRAGADLFPVVGAAKDRYARPRPFVTEQGPICITPSEEFARSGSYPSGHAASGWLYALLLAEIDPGNTAAIVRRGRAFGESRVVCGVHYLSDVEGGRLTATTLVAALHGVPEFETDIAAARAELIGLKSGHVAAPAPAACSSENGNLATPW
jgi:acid phosphatase (class A)